MPNYLIDGTNLLNLNGEKSLKSLFYLLDHLLKNGDQFTCFFDPTTCDDHIKDLKMERRLYRYITKKLPQKDGTYPKGFNKWDRGIVCEEFFQEAGFGKADYMVLALAKDWSDSLVITGDKYEKESTSMKSFSFWTTEERKKRHRILFKEPHDLRLLNFEGDTLEIIDNAGNFDQVFLRVINKLESASGRLKGKVNFGFKGNDPATRIKTVRRQYHFGKALEFRQENVVEGQSFTDLDNKEVEFRIGLYKNSSNKYSLIANQVSPLKDQGFLLEEMAVKFEQLQEAFVKLQSEGDEKQARILEMRNEMEALESQVGQFKSEEPVRIKELEEEKQKLLTEIERLKALIEELEEKLKDRESEMSQKAFQVQELEGQVFVLENQLDEASHLAGQGPEGLQHDYRILKTEHLQLVSLYQIARRKLDLFENRGNYLDLGRVIQELQAEVDALNQKNILLQRQIQELASGYPPSGNNGKSESTDIKPDPEVIEKVEPVIPTFTQAPKISQELKGELSKWWSSLSQIWREDLSSCFFQSVKQELTEEDLAILGQQLARERLNLAQTPNLPPLPHTLTFIDSKLVKLSRLRILNLSYHQIRSLAGIEGLKNLEELVLSRNPIHSLNELADLPNLRELRIHDVPVSTFEIDTLKRKNPNLHVFR